MACGLPPESWLIDAGQLRVNSWERRHYYQPEQFIFEYRKRQQTRRRAGRQRIRTKSEDTNRNDPSWARHDQPAKQNHLSQSRI